MAKVFNGITIPIALFVTFLVGYGILTNRVETNFNAIAKVEEAPLKIAVIEKAICNLKQAFEEFKADQKDMNKAFNAKLDKILELVK